MSAPTLVLPYPGWVQNGGLTGRLTATFTAGARGVTARVSTTPPLELRGPFAGAHGRPFAEAGPEQRRGAHGTPSASDGGSLPRFFLRNVTAGLFPGDVTDVALRVEPGARVAVAPTSATKVHAPPTPGAPGARARLRVEVLPGATLDHDAGVTILHADSDLEQDVELVVHPGGELVYRELIAFGRLARGERLAFARFAGDLRVTSPSGDVAYRERATLRPADDLATLDAAVGGAGVVGTLLILGDPERALERAYALAAAAPAAAYAGASALPNGCGAIVRVLAAGVESARAALTP